MDDKHTISRRTLLALIFGAGIAALVPASAFADGGSGSGSNSDSGGGSNSGSGSDSGADDNGGDGDNDEDDENGSSGSSGIEDRDQDEARDAVRNGKAISLSRAMGLLKQQHDGRVIAVTLREKGNRLDYRFKVVDGSGKVVSVTMDARTGRIRRFLGL